MFKKSLLLSLAIFSVVSFYSCQKCQTIILCHAKNEVYYKVVGNDTFSLYVPNCFTPEGNGVNDNFQVFGRNITTVNVKVYDGLNLVATLNSFNDQWDGKVSGEAHVRVYTLIVNAKTTKGENISFTGTLSSVIGLFQGLNEPKIYEHAIAQYENAQFAMQNDNGIYNPLLPTGEYLINREINKCGI